MCSEMGDLLGRVARVIVPDSPNATASQTLHSGTLHIVLHNMNRAKDRLRTIQQLLCVGICEASCTLQAAVDNPGFRLMFHCSTGVHNVSSHRWPLIWKGGNPWKRKLSVA